MRAAPYLLALALALAAAAGGAGAERQVVTVAGDAAAVAAQLEGLGYSIALRGPGFLAIERTPESEAAAQYGGAKEAAFAPASGKLDSRLSSVDGVLHAEADAAHALMDGNLTDSEASLATAAGASGWLLLGAAQQQAGAGDKPPVDCSVLDKPLGYGQMPEIQPYFVSQVQADSAKLQREVPTTVGRGVMVCIIDSGVEAAHPEFSTKGSPTRLDGCKEEDDAAPAGCPFEWSSDLTGHGTHVSGIIGAPHNGLGMIGVIPEGAEIYLVRIFNNSGDVNQGQGFVYGSSLILAYTQCEGKLAELQATQHDKKWRMVINLSVGAPGPLTIEKLFFKEAAARPDMLFVSAAGNNGSDPYQWLNYPSAYEGVISVGAVNCANEVQPFSQRNARVDIVAPGRDILSSYPAAKSSAAGTGQGYLAYGSLSFNTAPAAIYSGSGAFSGPLADCGVANSSCPAASGGVCVVQSSARERQGADGAKSVVMPNACQLVQYCMENGAKGIVLVPPVEIPGFGAYPPDAVSTALLDCTLGGQVPCPCWDGFKSPNFTWPGLDSLYQSNKLPPVVAVSLNQYAKIRREAKSIALAAARGAGPAKGANASATRAFVRVVPYPYRRMSGTSMATPIVSGVAARVWAAFPDCTAQEVRDALFKSAKDIGPNGWDKGSGWGLVQAEAAFNYLSQQKCGGGSGGPAGTWRGGGGGGAAAPAPAAPARAAPGKAASGGAGGGSGATWRGGQPQGKQQQPAAAAAAKVPAAAAGGKKPAAAQGGAGR